MIITVEDVLSTEELAEIQQVVKSARFIDGKVTAGWHAKSVKNNTQIPREDQASSKLQTLVEAALMRNALVQAAAFPRRMHSILLSRYVEGMSYGRHVDNAMMGGNTFLRADVAFTVFLSSPEDYDGGELTIEGACDEQHYKLAAGSMVFYPASTFHRVESVTRGERLVAVGWIQSFIRDPQRRELLFDLDTARRSLFSQQGKTVEFDLLAKSYSNLLRMWSD